MAICATAVSTVPSWCPETREDDRIQVSEGLLQVHEVQRHYLLSLEERRGVHLSAVDSDYDERYVTITSTLA
jgi:hypothetical protein